MNNQTSVSSAFVNLSPCIISYPPISFSFNLSVHLFLCALILFFFHYLPLFLSSLLLTFVFMLSAWSCISAATVIRPCRRPKDASALSFSPESLLIRFPITLTQSEGTHPMLMQSYLSGIPFSIKVEHLSHVTCVRPQLWSCWSRLQSGKLECSAPSGCPVKTWPGDPKILSLSTGSYRCCATQTTKESRIEKELLMHRCKDGRSW